MSTDYLSGTTDIDHDLTLAIPGDAASVRTRVIQALQTLGYKVVAEQPILAKRGKQGAAKYDCSFNVLDYATTLTISLKQTNDQAILATFNYEVKSCAFVTKGDRRTLDREAEAIAALASERLAMSACRVCGTQVSDESHFCRRCGAPLVQDLPELEILRLVRGAQGAYHKFLTGVIALFLAALTLVPIFVVAGTRIFAPFFWAGVPLGIIGFIFTLQGLWQLHRTMNPKNAKSATPRLQPGVVASATTALPPRPVNASITEGTTDLLVPARGQRTPEPVPRRSESTAEIDPERLM
ncbi:MAG TPA: zinc-ribbon domain-containing protein [Pyrinomonadaceae bacterium]|nr:zinc-ribbon domain-containing protein [Pyrinomonadaceae bacterium]